MKVVIVRFWPEGVVDPCVMEEFPRVVTHIFGPVSAMVEKVIAFSTEAVNIIDCMRSAQRIISQAAEVQRLYTDHEIGIEIWPDYNGLTEQIVYRTLLIGCVPVFTPELCYSSGGQNRRNYSGYVIHHLPGITGYNVEHFARF